MELFRMQPICDLGEFDRFRDPSSLDDILSRVDGMNRALVKVTVASPLPRFILSRVDRMNRALHSSRRAASRAEKAA
jgi:hypothetical protein